MVRVHLPDTWCPWPGSARLVVNKMFRMTVIKYSAILISLYLLLFSTGLLHSTKTPTRMKTNLVEVGTHLNGLDNVTSDQCQTRHLGIVLQHPERVMAFVKMLKTLLHFRQKPLVIHIVTDYGIGHVMRTLFHTWELPYVDVKLYVMNDKIEMTDLSILQAKFMFYDVVSKEISEILIVDERLRFLQDVENLWNEFDKFDDKQIVGVPKRENQEIFYTDVLLLKLDRLRANKTLSAGDFGSWEEVFDMFSVFEELIYILPCAWHVRLQPRFDATRCLKGDSPKSFWWDDRSETVYMNNEEVENKKLIVSSIIHSDGEQYRYSTSPCLPLPPPATTTQPQVCQEFRRATKLKRRTHVYIYGNITGDGETLDKPYDVTLVTQLTPDRFTVLERIISQWEGPLHAVFHVSEDEGLKLPQMAAQSPALKNRHNVAFHAVYRRDVFNPINYLRNVGISESKTAYTFFVDVDLVPNKNLYFNLQKYIEKYLKNKQTVLVVPSFESFVPLDHFPNQKQDLLGYLANGSVEGYRMSKGWNLGHKPTNYVKWKTATVPYPAVFKDAFEPYVVIKTSEQVFFEESLLERMGDKLAHGRLIYAREYEFLVLPDQYVIHLPHPQSTGTQMWKRYPGYARCAGILFEEFRAKTKRRYPNQKVH